MFLGILKYFIVWVRVNVLVGKIKYSFLFVLILVVLLGLKFLGLIKVFLLLKSMNLFFILILYL